MPVQVTTKPFTDSYRLSFHLDLRIFIIWVFDLLFRNVVEGINFAEGGDHPFFQPFFQSADGYNWSSILCLGAMSLVWSRRGSWTIYCRTSNLCSISIKLNNKLRSLSGSTSCNKVLNIRKHSILPGNIWWNWSQRLSLH